MKIFLKLFIFLFALALTLGINAIAKSTPGEIAIEITPSPIQLAPNEQIKGILVIRNNSSTPIKELQLSILNNSHVEIAPQAVRYSDLQPGKAQLWNLTFIRPGIELSFGKIYFELTYQQEEKSGVILQSLEIQDRLPTPINKIAIARLETTLELLQERQDSLIYLIVTNISNSRIKITHLHSNSPSFLKIKIPNLAGGIALDPQASYVFQITLTADDTVNPTKHMIIFEVGLEWEEHNYVHAGNLIVTHKFNAGIVGESEILKLVGAPIFLLLPGVLMVYVFKILWNVSAPKQGMPSIPLNLTLPEFWVVAILFSLITTYVYPILTGLAGNQRDYLVAYGLFDIFLVWIGSIFAGFLVWVIVAGIKGIHLWILNYMERHITPSENDNEKTLLEKLGRQQKNILLEQVDIPTGSELLRYFIVAPVMRDKTKIWAIPPITYNFTPQATDNFKTQFSEKLDSASEKLDSASESIDPLVQLIQNEDGKQIELRWKYGKGPIKIDKKQDNNSLSRRCFLEEA